MSAFDPKRTSAAQNCCRANRPLNPISPVANPCCNRRCDWRGPEPRAGNATTRFHQSHSGRAACSYFGTRPFTAFARAE